MRRMIFLLIILLALIVGCVPTTVRATTGFITRSGNVFLINGVAFRFGGSNLHSLGMDCGNGTCHLQNHVTTDSSINAALGMHETVIRGMNMGISAGCSACIEPSLNSFNDANFEADDYALQKASAAGLRVIIPFPADGNVNAPHGWEGTFTNWRGLADTAFYTNSTVLADYKTYISHFLNHVNQYTGIAYKNDPAIAFWETGNEQRDFNGNWAAVDNTWLQTVGSYIHNQDTNHLVADGHELNMSLGTVTTAEVQVQAIGIYSQHFYTNSTPIRPADVGYTSLLQQADSLTKTNGKALFTGEWDWTSASGSTTDLQNFLSAIEQSTVGGDTFWNLVPGPPTSCGPYCLFYPFPAGNQTTRGNILTQHALTM